MSSFESHQDASNIDGNLSDGTWSSDFDDSPLPSDYEEIPPSQVYSQEIEDNKINENLEAQLAKVSNLNSQHTDIAPAVASVTTATPQSKILTKNLGAIPKTAFSYLNNEVPVNYVRKKLNTETNPKSNRFPDDVNLTFSDQSQRSNKPTGQSGVQPLVSSDIPLNSGNIKTLKNNQSSAEVTIQKPPGKLKPEAFSFLKTLANQPNNKTGEKNVNEERNYLVPTAFAHVKNLQHSQLSVESQKNIKIEKYEWIEPVPTAPLLSNVLNNPDNRVDMSPTNAFKLTEKLREIDSEIVKPPLPSRPPPIFKYPPGTFSQQPSGVSNKTKSVEQNFILPSSLSLPSSVQSIPKRTNLHPGTCADERLENVPMINEDKIAIKKVTVLIDTPLRNSINPDMLSRPLPPVPTLEQSNTSKSVTPANTVINRVENVKTKPEMTNQLISIDNTSLTECITGTQSIYPLPDSSSEKTAPITQKINPEDTILRSTPVPELKPTTQQRLSQIIGNQTHVSSDIFLSQHKISSAIAARLQNKPSRKSSDDSYENLEKEITPHVTSDRRNTRRSLGSNMETPKPDVPPRPENNPIMKENAQPRPFSDIDVLQNSMTRPCLPQKLRNTQRSVSCTSLVQTIKDMSFSIWNHSDKDKRNSDGTTSYEKAAKILIKENDKYVDKSKILRISSIPSNEDEAPSKVVASQEQKIGVNISSEKSMMVRYAWYHDIDAKQAQLRLLALGQDGTFLIRPSSRPTNEIQHTACVVYSGRVLNLHIRRKSNGQYGLGKEKEGEKTFPSLSDLIKHHQEVPIEIRPTIKSPSSPESFYVCLRVTPPK